MPPDFSSIKASAVSTSESPSRPSSSGPDSPDGTEAPKRFLFWVDGVGAFLLFTGNRVTVGGPTRESEAADLVLLANLSRRHATFIRSNDGYVLEAHAACKVADRPVEKCTHLNSNYRLELASGVRLQFRIPSVLSATAVIDFLSDHRPNRSIDGVILMDEACLLGPGRENHIVCPGWNEAVLLYRRPDGFWCKSQSPIMMDGRCFDRGGPVAPGAYVSGSEFGFRLEPCP